MWNDEYMNFIYLNHMYIWTMEWWGQINALEKIIAVEDATYAVVKPWPLRYQRIAFNHFIFIFRGYMYIMNQFNDQFPVSLQGCWK